MNSRVVVALCVVAGLGLSSRVTAQPRGDAHLWAEERYEAWGPFGEVRDWDGARLHADGRFFPVNAGAWTFWLDAAETGQELRLQARNIPSTWGRWSAQLGDYVVDEPRQDPLRTEFQQVMWARGASLALERRNLTFALHGGTLTERKGIFGWGRLPVFEPTYGAMLHGKWTKDGLWKVDWNRQEGAPGFPRGVQQAAGFMGHMPSEGWSWLGEVRASREDETGTLGESAIAGGGWKRGKFTSSAHARIFSPGFRNLGLYDDVHRNEWGGRFEMSYRPRPQLLAGTSWDWARDLEARPGQVSPESRLITRVFAASNLAGPFTWRADLGYRNRTTTDPES
ncbi:MAG TPA: hypothetical protein VFP10_12855, partial [Candidatus Eisenbacteria bacterium]|nr:hypothetical protein [Candidatus Eisenbacteria bacterium]